MDSKEVTPLLHESSCYPPHLPPPKRLLGGLKVMYVKALWAKTAQDKYVKHSKDFFFP